MDINLEYYRIFYYVAKYKNVTMAANALHLSQSALSQTIKKLEFQLEKKLFIRSSGGMKLTPMGMELFEAVKDHIESLDNLKYPSNSSFENPAFIQIGAVESALHGHIFDIIMKFDKTFPNLKMHVTGSRSDEILSLLENGSVDIGFTFAPERKRNSIILEPITTFSMAFVASQELYPELFTKAISISQLADYPLICHEISTSSRHYLQEEFSKYGLRLDPKFSMRTSTQILALAEMGLGIGILPEYFSISKTLGIIPLKESLPKRDIYMAYSSSYPQSYPCVAFRKMVKDEMGCSE